MTSWVRRRYGAKADMCARPDRPTYTRWVALLLLLLACASMAGCLGPGLEPPNSDNASGEPDEGGADGGPVVNPPGASGSGGRGASSGGGGSAAPGAGQSGGSSGMGMPPTVQDAGEMGDAGIDDEDAGATR
jgi:uncharacterized membrane protein YgcG